MKTPSVAQALNKASPQLPHSPLHRITKTLPLPSDTAIQKIAIVLERQQQDKERSARYAPIQEVLAMLGRGALLTGAILAPKSIANLAPLLMRSPNWDEWKHYNMSYLRRTLKELEKQKHVEIQILNDQEVVALTNHGKRKILHYSLDAMTIKKPKTWDGLWRVVIYDIPKDKNSSRDVFRETLMRLGFYKLQESVYLLPYPCFDEIEFIRQYYFLGIKVQYLLVQHIENDGVYRAYFALE